jgi:hypothetical protein
VVLNLFDKKLKVKSSFRAVATRDESDLAPRDRVDEERVDSSNENSSEEAVVGFSKRDGSVVSEQRGISVRLGVLEEKSNSGLHLRRRKRASFPSSVEGGSEVGSEECAVLFVEFVRKTEKAGAR